ncbi:MAG: hypothetical protein AB1728_11030 [Bacteroidota bacterium]
MKSIKKKFSAQAKIFAALSLFSVVSFAQVAQQQIQMFRDEPKGNIQYRKKGMLEANLVRTVYSNDAQISDWFNGVNRGPHGEWPKGTGHRSLDGLALLIGAKVKITNAFGQEQYITPIQSQYREEMDFDPVTSEIWGIEPVPGYVSSSSTIPAINIDKYSFPEQWPRSLFYDLYGTNEAEIKKWDGFWYGYFGRGVNNAQAETFFVVDDSQDKEFTRAPYGFYPVKSDSTRGGLGLRVEVRAFEWTHVLAEDCIFWHYDIINLSDYDYDSTAFGFYTDPSVGSTQNDAMFNRTLDLAYAWAPSGKGLPDNYKTGYYGQAYLESPGDATNGIDDDEDGLIDERRDDGIDNDGDWRKYSDKNLNGRWDPEEPLNDDLGKDGVGPFDLQYTGPDEGEGDGLPTPGEPYFDKTDKDESDQIGLQSAYIGLLADKGPSGVWPKNDPVMWRKMTEGFRDTSIRNANISMVFASGPFPLKKNQRERFSFALLWGDDFEDLLFNLETVKNIYNANYNFAEPPLKPTLTAVAGNKKVYLYWDDVAERSYDRLLKQFDFEGYALYRSTEPEFQDVKTITDAKGDPKYWKPMMQWDLVNNIKGPDPTGINGAHYWRGNDTGLEHSFVDTTVQNGVKYYYALVSYDRGVFPNTLDSIDGSEGGISVSECTKQIQEDFNGTLKFVDINCAVVVPTAQAAGYVPPQIVGTTSRLKQGIGTGSMTVSIVNPNAIGNDVTYKVMFDSTGGFPKYKTRYFFVIRDSLGNIDTLLKNTDINKVSATVPSSAFDGLTVSIKNDTAIALIDTSTGWVTGRKTNAVMRAAIDRSIASLNAVWPSDYEIRFFDTVQDTGAIDDGATYIKAPVNFTITNLTVGYRTKFLIQDIDGSRNFSSGDTIRILDGYKSDSDFKICYKVSFVLPPINAVPPGEGDRFILRTTKPFASGDFFEFKTRAARIDPNTAANQLSKISVVPNPYVATAKWERRTLYQTGRGERKIDFINLPAQCTIRIFTVAGALVKTLYHNGTANNGSASWDLISDDGMEIAYGLYIFHVEAPAVGDHIGKFVVIK